MKADCYWVFKVKIEDDGTESAIGIGVISPKLAKKKREEFEALPKEEVRNHRYDVFRTVLDKAGPAEGFTLTTRVTDLEKATLTEISLVFKALPIIKDQDEDKIKVEQ